MTIDPTWTVRLATLVGVSCAAVLVGVVVRIQLRGLGMRDPEDGGIRWARVISGLATWLVLLGGLGFAAYLDEQLALVSHYLFEGFSVLLPFLPASIVLATASAWARERRSEARRTGDPTAAAEARWGMVAAGAVSGLIAAQADAFATLVLLAVLGAGAWLLVDPGARARVSDAWAQLQAGSRLRTVLKPETVLQRDGREVLVVGPVGLLATDVLIDGEARLLANRELLLLAAAQHPTPT